MTTELRTLDHNIVASLVINGDLKKLAPSDKVAYYNYRCSQAGLDPAAKPFDLLVLNGKEVLYANAACTQQLCNLHKLSHTVTNRELVDDIYCVFVKVSSPDGRSTENMGAVPVGGLKGEAKANAMLKATTKAIRRAVLAHCGLGMLDETETETIPGAIKIPMDAQAELIEGEEWTDEDIAGAKQALMDFGQILMDKGLEDAEIKAILDKPRKTIGDPTITLEKWLNRLTAYHSRTIAGLKVTA